MNDRIKFSGHTMGAPKCDIYQAIDLFKAIGYDGIEVRVADNGQINSETITDDEAKKIYAAAQAKGMEFSCLTSYYQNFVKMEEREDVHIGLSRGRSGGLIFPSLSELPTVYCDPHKGFGIVNKAEIDFFLELSMIQRMLAI